jgi:hypothetical protein
MQKCPTCKHVQPLMWVSVMCAHCRSILPYPPVYEPEPSPEDADLIALYREGGCD